MRIVYFTSKTGNTKRFADKLEIPSIRLASGVIINEPYVLFVPTYADTLGKHSVATPIIKFLNDENNRSKLIGVVGFGNRNFGKMFALGSEVVARKCNVPLLDKVELFGTPEDVERVKERINDIRN